MTPDLIPFNIALEVIDTAGWKLSLFTHIFYVECNLSGCIDVFESYKPVVQYGCDILVDGLLLETNNQVFHISITWEITD